MNRTVTIIQIKKHWTPTLEASMSPPLFPSLLLSPKVTTILTFIKITKEGTDWCGPFSGASSCKAKAHWFDSCSGHMPGLQAYFSPFLPLFPSL